tara:strand:+ start:486 stop:881 length:396 start_codon:yes stop_codon:yes gene_type:complete
MMKNSVQKNKLRKFGILIGFGFPILIGWLLPVITGHGFRVWTLLVGVPLLILGILKPLLLLYPYEGWMALGVALGWINSRIILGLVYFLVLQPIAIVMKIMGYDPLKTKKNNEKSYREVKINHRINLKKIF